MIYQRISLATTEPVGDPGALPFAVANWKPEQVLDLSGLDAAYGLKDAGFWPVVDDIPEHDPATETVVAGDLRQDAAGKRFVREWTVEAIPVTSAHVNAERDRRFELGFYYGGVLYQSDRDSRENVAGAGTMALGAMVSGKQPGDLRWARPDRDFTWTAADNTHVPMDAQTVFSFASYLGMRKEAFIKAAQAIKAMEPIPSDYATNDAYWPSLAP